MYDEEVVLCGSSAYTKTFYLNEEFDALPEAVKEELKILCVLFTEDVGGVLTLVFDEEGNLSFRTECEEDDILYDEIGSVLKIKQYQREKTELMESLEKYFKVVFLGEDYAADD
jgi:hypothetical protein